MLKQLNKSEISELNALIESEFGRSDFFSKKDRVLLVDFEDAKVVVRDKTPLFFYIENNLLPTLKTLLAEKLLKQIIVDMGAVKFVTNGADVMRPGITVVEDGIIKGDFVVVVDETHNKPLAVCEALLSGEEIMASDSGKVLRNVHFVGDSLWNYVHK